MKLSFITSKLYPQTKINLRMEFDLFSPNFIHTLCKLSKPQPNLNTTVGFDMKMTLQTPPTTTEIFQALLDELES